MSSPVPAIPPKTTSTAALAVALCLCCLAPSTWAQPAPAPASADARSDSVDTDASDPTEALVDDDPDSWGARGVQSALFATVAAGAVAGSFAGFSLAHNALTGVGIPPVLTLGIPLLGVPLTAALAITGSLFAFASPWAAVSTGLLSAGVAGVGLLVLGAPTFLQALSSDANPDFWQGVVLFVGPALLSASTAAVLGLMWPVPSPQDE